MLAFYNIAVQGHKSQKRMSLQEPTFLHSHSVDPPLQLIHVTTHLLANLTVIENQGKALLKHLLMLF